ncbi:hypoxia induced protein conserved region-domain-containing protein [Glomus cerebriforme]|uniref:Hypoxia induced protein conserved region-domain-containing protein n=1 Tax=Glomus cerebriforme TaxID=658196 RepID=A0A397TTL1_9GLOM|nr:hypoxia induced protein conserved region-domain-containing protein [Glomus cerebriforme]
MATYGLGKRWWCWIMSQQTEPSSSNTPATQIHYETLHNRFVRKMKEHPLVPLGMFATVFALAGATIGFYKGDSKTMQQFLRFRVAAQGFTVLVAVGAPTYYQLDRYINNNKQK